MSLKNPNTVYFLGIGGIGMSAIARYYLAMGFIFSKKGYIRERNFFIFLIF